MITKRSTTKPHIGYTWHIWDAKRYYLITLYWNIFSCTPPCTFLSLGIFFLHESKYITLYFQRGECFDDDTSAMYEKHMLADSFNPLNVDTSIDKMMLESCRHDYLVSCHLFGVAMVAEWWIDIGFRYFKGISLTTETSPCVMDIVATIPCLDRYWFLAHPCLCLRYH